jgi:hypothetical protein
MLFKKEGVIFDRNAFRKILRSRDSVVGIATGYGLDNQGGGGVRFQVGYKNFHFSISSRPALGSTHREWSMS